MRTSCRCLVGMAVLLVVGMANTACAGALYRTVHGRTYKEIAAWIKGELDGYRPVYLNGYDSGGSARFAAVAVKDGQDYPWSWCVGPLDRVRKKDADQRARGFRTLCVSGFLDGDAPKYAVLWVKDGRPANEKISLHLTEKEFSERVNREKKNNYMPQLVTAYADGGGSYRFTALFVPAGGRVWEEQHDLTAERYQKAFDQQGRSEGRPLTVAVYPTASGLRFAVVFVKKDGAGWSARHALTAEEYQEEFVRLEKEFHPVCITGYPAGKQAGPELFDEVMRRFMKERYIPAGTLAVSHDGKLLLERGYGFADREKHRRIEPDAPMRLASVTKPITAAAVRKLIREGKLSLDTKAFALLGLKPPPGRGPDPRLNDITVQHLLEHKGGWDRDKTFDPMGRPLEIAESLKVPAPAGPVDVIRYMMGQPLQFDPGSRTSYSNFGYCVLGRVIEKVSGETYLPYVRKNIFAPLGADSIDLGRSLPKDRNPREPFYRHPGKGRNVLDPHSKESVPLPDGGFYLEAMDAHGGLIASSRDVLRFLDHYWISGEPRRGAGRPGLHTGRLPGTFTLAMQRPNGVNVVVLFNQDADPSGLDYGPIINWMRTAADRQTGPLTHYAALWVRND